MFPSGFRILSRSSGVIVRNYVHSSSICRTAKAGESKIEDPIVVTDDGKTIVCWHPEKEFPYECTRPMPEIPVRETTVLKTTKAEAMKCFQKKRPEIEAREELAKMTQTTIHRWFPRSRDKKAKKTPKDRPYL